MVAIKAITKKNLAKSQNLLSKEIKILIDSSLFGFSVVAYILDSYILFLKMT